MYTALCGIQIYTLPVFEMRIGLACMVALLVLFLFKMRRNILQKAQPALS